MSLVHVQPLHPVARVVPSSSHNASDQKGLTRSRKF